MGVYYETIPNSQREWILDQKMLWVGTAPLSPDGHINISPKGGQYFGIVDEHTFWFMDLSGSGVETTAHLHEPGNGRICIMFIAFEGPPKIIRIWGKARAVENGTQEFATFVEGNKVKTIPGSRSIIVVDVDQVATSCGFSVPFYEFKGYRDTLNQFFEKKEKRLRDGDQGESMERYWAWKSQLSVDGLPGMKRGYEYAQKHNVAPLKKFVGKAAQTKLKTPQAASPVQMLLAVLLGMVIGAVLVVSLLEPEVLGRIQGKEIW